MIESDTNGPVSSQPFGSLRYLCRHPYFATRDPDVAGAAICRDFAPATVKPRQPRDYYLDVNHVSRGPFAISCSASSGYTIDMAPIGTAYVLLLPITGRGEVRYGRDSTVLAAGTAGAMVSPHRACSFRFGNGFSHFVVRIPAMQVDNHLRTLVGRGMQAPPEFSLPVTDARGTLQSLTRLVAFFVGEMDQQDTLLHAEAVFRRAEDLIVTALVEHQAHSYSHLLSAPPSAASVQQVRDAEAYLEAHCHKPLRMHDVADALGISLRSLQMSFKTHRGCSPSHFLRRVRLQRAHKLLQSGQPGITVTGVAHACGFLHLGQFGLEYRRLFSERPSETLGKNK